MLRLGEGAAKKAVVRSHMRLKDRPNEEHCLDLLLDEPANFSSLASLLRRYGKDKALYNGRRVHSYLTKCGYDRNTFLGNCLLQMYGDCGDLVDVRATFGKILNPNLYTWNILIKVYGQNGSLDDARRIFNRMPLRDVISWNAMIAAFVHNWHAKEALDIFHQMQAEGITPNDITFVCALDACINLGDLEEGQEIHAATVDSGFDQDVMVGTAIVNMYGKCGSIDKARSMFYRMPHHNIVSWNAMISAFAQNRQGKEALDLFYQMQSQGVNPTHVTFVCALEACSSVIEGYWIHSVILDNGCEQNIVVVTALVNLYGKSGSLPDAESVFGRIQNRTVVSWNNMIAAFAQNGLHKNALGLFHLMCSDGVKPNKVTFVCFLDVCTDQAALIEGHTIHAAIASYGWHKDPMVGTSLINMYGKCGSLHDARSVFSRILQQNAVSWTAMMAALTENGHVEEALSLFQQMQLEGIKPDNVTFGFAIDACTRLAVLEVGKEIDNAVVNSEYWQDVAVGNALINMFGKCGSINDASSVFERMAHRNIISWTSMMAVFSENGRGKEALGLYYQMQLESIEPDRVTFLCAIETCASLAALKEGWKIEAAVIDSGHGQDVVVGTALINMYGKCGSILDVRRVFGTMPQRDVVSWTAIIAAFAQSGYGVEALALFVQMQLLGIKPNDITFICVLTACSHTGLIDDARHFFVSMQRDHGLKHTIDHYLCMIDLLGRAGHLGEAESLIRNLSSENAALAWLCLLSACRIHGDTERSERAANHCFELDSTNDAAYVMLSNIYAEAGRWNDVAVIRGAMKESGMQELLEHA